MEVGVFIYNEMYFDEKGYRKYRVTSGLCYIKNPSKKTNANNDPKKSNAQKPLIGFLFSAIIVSFFHNFKNPHYFLMSYQLIKEV